MQTLAERMFKQGLITPREWATFELDRVRLMFMVKRLLKGERNAI